MSNFWKHSAHFPIIVMCATMSYASASADSLFSICIHDDHTKNDCYVVPNNQQCPDGYSSGNGETYVTREAGCSAHTFACVGGRHWCADLPG
jgi:hypothetical protein